MKTIEDVKALPGYSKFKKTLNDLKVSASIYVSTAYLDGDWPKPIIVVNTVNPKAILNQVMNLMPEFENEEPDSMADNQLGFIPAFFNENDIGKCYTFVEEVDYSA